MKMMEWFQTTILYLINPFALVWLIMVLCFALAMWWAPKREDF